LSSTIRFVLIFGISLSLLTLPGPFAGQPVTVHANPAPIENWYPSGPAFNTLTTPFFTDENSEFVCLQTGCIDLTDWPLSPALISQLIPNPGLFVTSPISAKEYFELEFHLGTNFWGCQMNFGNSGCGRDIRQGVAHLVDKTIFTSTQAEIAGLAITNDNPYPPSTGLPSPNPCAWDPLFPQTGPNCTVGSAGGTAYHLAAATGVTYPWQPALGSLDFCAAATHFISAGVATGKNSATCVLTGISSAASANPVNLFPRSDSPPRLELGNGIGQGICALFTGSFTTGCTPYLSVNPGPSTAFPGFSTSPTTVSQTWNMYTAGFINVLTFDNGFYFSYNSQFVSGIPSIKQPTGPCSSQSVPSFVATNYMYLCNSNYDSISRQMEFAPCLNAPGDPSPGQTTPTFANCPSSSQLTATSAGYQTANLFGQNAYTIPIWSGQNQYAYLSNWRRAVLHQGNGLLNYFSTLNAYSPNPAVPQTIRQGYKQTTRSLNPYIASTFWDFGIIGNIWDSLNTVNPEGNSQLLDWMTARTSVIQNSGLSYVPPNGTIATYRFQLRNDIFWQDGRKLTAWDVAFSYQSLKATGSFQGSALAPMTGVKVLSATQMDVNVNGNGPFTRLALTSPTIIPGRYWSGQCQGGIWDANVALGKVPDTCMTADPNKIQPTFDPLAAGILVGSGPWACKSSTGMTGGGCSSSGSMNPPVGGSYTLSRYGTGTTPGGSLNTFFRSNGNLALWTWTSNTGTFSTDFLNFGVVSLCFGAPTGTAGCTHWQQGIGSSGAGSTVGLTQVSIVQRYVGVNWIMPYDWVNSAPAGITTPSPVLYEGTATLNPASVAGCANPYPVGGYDC
jgi:ABC-type transport system substrate-binding protein